MPTKTNCYGQPADISYGGAAWYYDIKLGDINYGWVAMDIETKKTNTTGSTILLAKYYHKVGIAGGIGLNIGYASITVSSGSNYHCATKQSSWSY